MIRQSAAIPWSMSSGTTDRNSSDTPPPYGVALRCSTRAPRSARAASSTASSRSSGATPRYDVGGRRARRLGEDVAEVLGGVGERLGEGGEQDEAELGAGGAGVGEHGAGVGRGEGGDDGRGAGHAGGGPARAFDGGEAAHERGGEPGSYRSVGARRILLHDGDTALEQEGELGGRVAFTKERLAGREAALGAAGEDAGQRRRVGVGEGVGGEQALGVAAKLLGAHDVPSRTASRPMREGAAPEAVRQASTICASVRSMRRARP